MHNNLNAKWLLLTLIVLFSLLLGGCVSSGSVVLPPRQAWNVFCMTGRHRLPDFTADQVLLVRAKGERQIEGSTEVALNTPDLEFEEGAFDVDACSRELKRLWKSGRYRVIVYDRSEETLDKPLQDNPQTRALREFALVYGIPLVILCGADIKAPDYPGIPQGWRQYWQCPKCAQEYWKHRRPPTMKELAVNLLMFPLNVVPYMVGGVCFYTFGLVFCAYDLEWFVIRLPFVPLWGGVVGFMNAFSGTPFWEMDILNWYDPIYGKHEMDSGRD